MKITEIIQTETDELLFNCMKKIALIETNVGLSKERMDSLKDEGYTSIMVKL